MPTVEAGSTATAATTATALQLYSYVVLRNSDCYTATPMPVSTATTSSTIDAATSTVCMTHLGGGNPCFAECRRYGGPLGGAIRRSDSGARTVVPNSRTLRGRGGRRRGEERRGRKGVFVCVRETNRTHYYYYIVPGTAVVQ